MTQYYRTSHTRVSILVVDFYWPEGNKSQHRNMFSLIRLKWGADEPVILNNGCGKLLTCKAPWLFMRPGVDTSRKYTPRGQHCCLWAITGRLFYRVWCCLVVIVWCCFVVCLTLFCRVCDAVLSCLWCCFAVCVMFFRVCDVVFCVMLFCRCFVVLVMLFCRVWDAVLSAGCKMWLPWKTCYCRCAKQ